MNAREIKFRGKQHADRDWIIGGLHQHSDGTCRIITDVEEFTVIPETVGQYTGLKDKNVVEIFEGDICDNYYSAIGFVRFDHGWAIEYSKKYSHDMPQMYCDNITVIGNITDNADLLN